MTHYTREEWGGVALGNPWSFQSTPDGWAIHHWASRPPGWAYDADYIRSVEQGEIRAGYNALAYHEVHWLNGDTCGSRPFWSQGAATGGHNHHTLALAAPGYFHRPHHDQPTDALIRSMAQTIYRCRQSGECTPDAIVRPHTWWTAGTQWATACCGEDFIPLVEEIERLSYTDSGAEQPAPRRRRRNGVEIIWGQWWDGTVWAFEQSHHGIRTLNGGGIAFWGGPQEVHDFKSFKVPGSGRHDIPLILVDPVDIDMAIKRHAALHGEGKAQPAG